MTVDDIVTFILDKLHDDIAEGGENKLNLTNIHHHDEFTNCVTVETRTGEMFTIQANTYYRPQP